MEEKSISKTCRREENVIKLCELKRAIESSPGYEEACATRDQILGWYHAESAGFGGPLFAKKCAPPWSIFDVNLVYMNVDIWHTAFQKLKGIYVHNNDDDDDANNRYKDNKTTTTSRLLLAVNICGEKNTSDFLKAKRLCENDGFACEARGCEQQVHENDLGIENSTLPQMCNLIGNLSVCDWIEHAKPTAEEIKIISEMPSVKED